MPELPDSTSLISMPITSRTLGACSSPASKPGQAEALSVPATSAARDTTSTVAGSDCCGPTRRRESGSPATTLLWNVRGTLV